MSHNKNLHKAKRNKNDEFYTQLVDIENELKHYKEHFEGKVVYSNCDRADSAFVQYFRHNFNVLGLKYYYNTSNDFRSEKSVHSLQKADIIVTNPPFSLFREFVALLMKYRKKFLIIGNMNVITYKEIFPLIKDNKLWLGNHPIKEFIQPDGTIKKFGNILWYTNLTHKKRNEELILYHRYKGNESKYPKYDNYDAIEVSKTKDIPKDYYGAMGVPISFLDKYNPVQFEIVGSNRGVDQDPNGIYGRGSYLNGKETFKRLFIKRRKN